MQTRVYHSKLINDLTFFALNIATNSCASQEDAQKVKRTLRIFLKYVLGTQENVEISRKLGLAGLTQKIFGVIFSLFLSCLRYPEILLCTYEFVSSFSFEKKKNGLKFVWEKKEVIKPLSMTKFNVQYINPKYLR